MADIATRAWRYLSCIFSALQILPMLEKKTGGRKEFGERGDKNKRRCHAFN